MCNPAIAVMAVSMAMSAKQASAQKQSGNVQAQVAEMNAKISDQAANDAINRGGAEADKQRSRARQLAGTQSATMAANGVDLGTGGAMDILGDTAAMGELDALTVLNNASREAYGHRVSAFNERLSGAMGKRQSDEAYKKTILTSPLKAYGAYQMGGGTWSPFSSSASSAAAPKTGPNMFSNARKSGF